MIGSSLLFVYDDSLRASVWMIDFGKSGPLPANIQITHREPWSKGNYEDGYGIGLDNILWILQLLIDESDIQKQNSPRGTDLRVCGKESNDSSNMNTSTWVLFNQWQGGVTSIESISGSHFVCRILFNVAIISCMKLYSIAFLRNCYVTIEIYEKPFVNKTKLYGFIHGKTKIQ